MFSFLHLATPKVDILHDVDSGIQAWTMNCEGSQSTCARGWQGTPIERKTTQRTPFPKYTAPRNFITNSKWPDDGLSIAANQAFPCIVRSFVFHRIGPRSRI